MNLFDSHDADDCLGPESQPSGHAIEAILRGRGLPAPAAGFRDSVVIAMEEAAVERRLMLAGQAQGAQGLNPRRRLLPEMVAEGTAGVADEPDVRLARALVGLPEAQREVVALKIDGGLTFAQIAKVTNVSLNTAAGRYRYALDKLRAALAVEVIR